MLHRLPLLPTGIFLLLSTFFVASASSAAEPDFDVVRAFKTLASTPDGALQIPPGRYLLPKGGLVMEKCKGATVHAAGVTFVATDLSAPALQFIKCENVTVKGLAIDFDPLPFTQGTITSVDPATGTMEFTTHTGYPELSDVYLAEKQLHLFEKDAPRWKAGAPDFYPKEIQRLTPTSGRVLFPKGESGLDFMQPGDRVALTTRKVGGIQVKEGCKGMRFESVTIHSAPGIGILVRFAEEAGTYHQVRVVPGPRPAGAAQDRLLSTSADAFNAAYARKGPIIEKCEFSHMGDDSINLHGIMLPVLKWLDDRTFLSMRPHRGEPFDRLVHPGDELRLLQEPDYAVVAVGAVESFERTTAEKTEDWSATALRIWPTTRKLESAAFYKVRLTAPVPAGLQKDGLFCEIPATNASGFVIRDSYFHDHRARGLRLMACDGVVEDNRFERLKGPAITLGGEFAFWREAGWCRNITVRRNHITNVCEGENVLRSTNYTPGAISIMARVVPGGADTRYFKGNENITISDNVIDGCTLSGIHVVAARGVQITNNQIRNVNTAADSSKAGLDSGVRSSKPIEALHADVSIEEGKHP
jgi:parallel beta-helix repeat protein